MIDYSKPIQVIDGRKARVICNDLAGGGTVVAIMQEDGREFSAVADPAGVASYLINFRYAARVGLTNASPGYYLLCRKTPGPRLYRVWGDAVEFLSKPGRWAYSLDYPNVNALKQEPLSIPISEEAAQKLTSHFNTTLI